jgi:hypothetical protein
MRQRLAELIDIIYGFRKFIAFMLLFLTAVIFRIKSLVDGGQFVDLMKTVAMAFFAANGIEHFTEAAKSFYNSQAKPVAGTTPPNLPPPSEEP